MRSDWTPAQIKRLKGIYAKKEAYVTDYELAGRLASSFKRSPESIRWQLRQFHREPGVSPVKILLLDIETMYIKANVWGTIKQYINPHQIELDWSILCWSAKWLFGDKNFGEVVTRKEAQSHTDKSIMAGVWKLMNEADVVVWQNGDEFDAKRLNTRFLVNGFPKPMYYKSIDTYKTLKENFSFTYNKLDWVANVLGIGRKIQTDFSWWNECEKGSQVYLDKMLEYNKIDVELTEELYLKLRPWMNNHPNIGVHSTERDTDCCPTCGSAELKWDGRYKTPLGLYKAFRCQRCSAIGRSTLKKFKIEGARVRN